MNPDSPSGIDANELIEVLLVDMLEWQAIGMRNRLFMGTSINIQVKIGYLPINLCYFSS